jgi:hypothetical protein
MCRVNSHKANYRLSTVIIIIIIIIITTKAISNR